MVVTFLQVNESPQAQSLLAQSSALGRLPALIELPVREGLLGGGGSGSGGGSSDESESDASYSSDESEESGRRRRRSSRGGGSGGGGLLVAWLAPLSPVRACRLPVRAAEAVLLRAYSTLEVED